ncbi:unnamed protein product [Mytilus edulis]|uniref:G-protein coupled receptors family 1 profile domain-containing protein n=1 Tax=Mytilus edulis TaxID=6550 RepID=A0A8S3RNK6_MYTED|nr:unnamed protein product [Mytilus edulis]
MATVIDYKEVLKDRYSDILLSHTILLIIGTVIGVIGNGATIIVYSSRIKERGERYFIPLLAIVDLIACLTISAYYVMNNTYFYDYPSNTVCCLLTFLQVFSSGLSAHILLIISIQRYLLVCKPFGPKMTLFWKKVSLAVACSFTLLYSCPLLGFSGTNTSEDVFMNHTINTTSCKFSKVDTKATTIFFGILALIIVCNLFITTALYIPVLKRIQISFPTKSKNITLATRNEQSIASQDVSEASLTKISGIELETDIQTTGNSKSPGENDTLNIFRNQELSNDADRSDDPPSYAVQQSSLHDNSISKEEENKDSPDHSSKSKSSSVKKRISIMFSVIILAYVISYIPPVVFVILRYTIENFNYITLSKAETFAWFYIARLIFVNHLVNPFIYCYFDVKLRRELKKCCTHKSKL